ncbi:MAG TPA: RDD family protein [Blastocatellia bacterium]|nr:RDD family protein [Blastocatellia bacterium]
MFQEYQVTYAGLWWRVLAYLIDGVIFSVVFFPLGILVGVALVSGGADQNSPILPGIRITLNGFELLVGWLYYAFLESSPWQGTIGKKLVGLRVTDLNGNRISFARATGRYFGGVLSAMICFVGFLMVAFTEKKQGLHDIMAGTLVLRGPAQPDYPYPPNPPDFGYRGGTLNIG